MKKNLISLVAVMGLLVAANCSAKEVKICETPEMFIKKDRTTIFPNMQNMNCFSYALDSQKQTNESFQKLYSEGWSYIGNYKAAIGFEGQTVKPHDKEEQYVYLVFEK